jgi:4-amino-4-deoxy-L-arabinose transferase-like glycosyltransferase
MEILGYALTSVYIILFIGLLSAVAIYRKDLCKTLRGRVTKRSLIALLFILIFFVSFLAMFVHPAEQLYFDENIYQGIALNILKHGNALWCQYGSAYLNQCGASAVYHDPVEWSFYIAMAFGVFGIGTATAYGMQLLIGTLLVVFTFLLGSVMKGEKTGVLSALAMSVMPELIIWSRAQAVPDLALASFATLAFFFFVVFMENKKSSTLLPFLFSLGIAVYIRTEGALLVPLFAILYFIYGDSSIRKNFGSSIRWLKELINKDELSLLYILLFAILLVPQAYYISGQLSNPQFGQGKSGLFSLTSFETNAPINVNYLFGAFDTKGYYPAAFPVEITLLAAIGTAVAIATSINERKNKAVVLALGLWFLTYFFFYSFFYAGAATYGVDSRMMLQLHPQLVILAAIGIVEISGLLAMMGSRVAKRRRNRSFLNKRNALIALPYAAFFIVIFFIFAQFFPIVTMPPSSAPQQSVILPASNFINSNYSAVPDNCLVFSFTPDMWYENGRASAQIGYLQSDSSNFTNFTKSYRCFVLDYGYWCIVPPYDNTTCPAYLKSYNTSILATRSINGAADNVSFYLLRNYS